MQNLFGQSLNSAHICPVRLIAVLICTPMVHVWAAERLPCGAFKCVGFVVMENGCGRMAGYDFF